METNESEANPIVPAPKSFWSSFTTKDTVALTISAFALLLSVFNAYYNTLRVSDGLQGRIMDCEVITRKNIGVSDSLLITIAYINSGNRQAIALVPSYQCVNDVKEAKTWGGLFNIKAPFPLVLEPQEMKLVQLKLSLTEIQKNIGANTKGNENLTTSYIRLKFYGLDSHAKLRDGKTNFQIKVNTKPNTIVSTVPSDNLKIYPENPPVEIF